MAEIKITQKRNNSTEICISGELTIYCAMAVYQEYFQDIKVKELTTIKLNKVTEIDTAGVQLLIMLIKIINAQQSKYQIESLGEALSDYSNLFQLNRYFVDFEEFNSISPQKSEQSQ